MSAETVRMLEMLKMKLNGTNVVHRGAGELIFELLSELSIDLDRIKKEIFKFHRIPSTPPDLEKVTIVIPIEMKNKAIELDKILFVLFNNPSEVTASPEMLFDFLLGVKNLLKKMIEV